jgi:hypothetical protein
VDVLRGVNARTLRTCLHQVGALHVAVILKRHNQEIKRATGSTEVTPVQPTAWRVSLGATIKVEDQLPEEYRAYRWTLDGQPLVTTRGLEHRFDLPGTYRLDGYASSPTSAEEVRTHVHVAYDVIVGPQER